MSAIEQWDAFDKQLAKYCKRTNVSEMEADFAMHIIIRKYSVDMYEAIEMLEDETVSVSDVKRYAEIYRKMR